MARPDAQQLAPRREWRERGQRRVAELATRVLATRALVTRVLATRVLATRALATRALAIVALSATSCVSASATPSGSAAPAVRPSASPVAPSVEPLSGPVAFRFADARASTGQPAFVDATDLRGRITVLAFVTTYDVASQAATRFVQRLAREHVPRLNVVLVVLEGADNRPLVEAYAGALDLSFPVVLADEATIRGEGPFEGLHHVPSFVVLDREGRERERKLGLMEYAELEALVRRVEQASGVKSPPRRP